MASGVFIVNFEQTWHIVPMFPKLTLNKQLPAGLPAYQHKPVEFQLFCLNLISLSNDS